MRWPIEGCRFLNFLIKCLDIQAISFECAQSALCSCNWCDYAIVLAMSLAIVTACNSPCYSYFEYHFIPLSQLLAIVFFYTSQREHITALPPANRGSATGHWERSTGVFVSTTHSSAAVETASGCMLCHWMTDYNLQLLCVLSTVNVQGFVLVVWMQGIREQTCWHPPGRLHIKYSERGQFKTRRMYSNINSYELIFSILLCSMPPGCALKPQIHRRW